MTRYIVSNTVIEPQRRDRFRRLSQPQTYKNLKTREPRVGERGTYTVELTEREARDLERDRPSNLRALERDERNEPHITANVPSPSDLRGHRADKLFEWGFTGSGIDVGVIDDGVGGGITALANVKAQQEFRTGSPASYDHGSPTASIALPRQAQLVAAAVGDSYFTSDIISALNWMAGVGVHVINCSFGTYTYVQAYDEAVQDVLDAGVEIFASAGNDATSTPQYPANFDGVECVGALDKNNGWNRASFSNYGSWVDLWMNGVGLAALDANGNPTTFSGTSAASPLATFVYASLLTKGLTSIGQLNTKKAMKDGGISREGGKIGRGEDGAYAMRNYCG